jgi:hypothetical protein
MTTKKKSNQASTKSKNAQKRQETTRSTRGRKSATLIADPDPVTPNIIAVTIVPPNLAEPVKTVAPGPSPSLAASATPNVDCADTPQPTQQPLTIGMFQKRLYELGFYGGHWDGVYGPLTRDAVCRFQAREGLPVNGDATPDTLTCMGLTRQDVR